MNESEIVAQQLRERSHYFAVDNSSLELSSPKIWSEWLEHTPPSPSGRSTPAMAIMEFDQSPKPYPHDHRRQFTRSRTAISRNQTPGKFEGQNLVASVVATLLLAFFCSIGLTTVGPANHCRVAAKESLRCTRKFCQIPTVNGPLLTRALAIALGLVGSTLRIFFNKSLCPVAKCPANAEYRHRLVLVPTEPVPPAFECAQA